MGNPSNYTGQTALFSEDDADFMVKILEDTSDSERHRFKLKVLKVTCPSKYFQNPKIGEEFNVEQVRQGGW